MINDVQLSMDNLQNKTGYEVHVNKYGGVSWKASLYTTDYGSLKNFVRDMQSLEYKYVTKQNCSKYNGYNKYPTKDDVKNFSILLTTEGEELFKKVKQVLFEPEFLEIKYIDKRERFIVYIICKIFCLDYDTIKNINKTLIPCTDFLPCNKGLSRDKHSTTSLVDIDGESELVCGCEFAPKWFTKNHFDNNYEDTISYSWSYKTIKIGVRIYKPKLNN